jgi:HAD superfamily hydrolase (TIGR01490 family)
MDVGAFFDLDKTLIECNSALMWARHERARGAISAWQMARAVIWHGLYVLSVVDIEKAFEEALRHYKGRPAAELERHTQEWFREQVQPLLRRQAEAAIAEHREAGHRLVLLTSSSGYEAAEAARAWGFEAWLANEFPADEQGNLLGTVTNPLCYGPGKVVHAEAWAAEHGVDLDRSYFYSDSYTDVPMLQRVGEPRVVTPDPRLRRAARRFGWDVLDWSRDPAAAP